MRLSRTAKRLEAAGFLERITEPKRDRACGICRFGIRSTPPPLKHSDFAQHAVEHVRLGMGILAEESLQ